MKVWAVILTYNEADIIGHTIDYLHGQEITVHLLDNESDDGTPDIGRSRGADVTVLSTDGVFDELAMQDALKQLIGSQDADWVIKNDADEYIESPFEGVTLRKGIELANAEGSVCIGTRAFLFYPMPEEPAHVPGTDVRRYYDHFQVWDRADYCTSDAHVQYNEVWKAPIFKPACGVRMIDPHRVEVLGDLKSALYPHLFILRHYPFRHPETTRQRLTKDRRDRLSKRNVDLGMSVHYLKYTEGSVFLETGFTFERLRGECTRWSKYRKAKLESD